MSVSTHSSMSPQNWGYMAVMDARTCERCRRHHGKIFTEERVRAEFPNMREVTSSLRRAMVHLRCRCRLFRLASSPSPQYMPTRAEIYDKALELFFKERPEAPTPEEDELKEGNYWLRARDELLSVRAIPLSEWERYRADVKSLAEELNILEEAAEERLAEEREKWRAEIERLKAPPPPKVPVPVKPLDTLLKDFVQGRISYHQYLTSARGLPTS